MTPALELPPTMPSTDQVTLVLLEPLTVAVKVCCWPGCRVAEVGVILIETPPAETPVGSNRPITL